LFVFLIIVNLSNSVYDCNFGQINYLSIYLSTAVDSGIYQCQASTIFGKTKKTSRLEVNLSPKQLTLGKRHVRVKSGSNVTLPVCHVTGHPNPKITWPKAIGSLPSNRTIIKGGQLTLLKSNKHDSGLYLCKAEHFLGSAIAASMLFVVELSVFVVKPLASYRALVGTNIVLNCAAKGHPMPVISWRKEDGVLPAGRYELRRNS
jgi:hypothetical protein